MPVVAKLPDSLEALARCQAVELSETRWRYDADQLIQTLQGRFAIEAERPVPGDAEGQTAWVGSAARLALDLLDLATHPTRLIARRQTGQAFDHIRAFVFLLVCLLVGNLMLLIGLNLHPSPSSVGGSIGGILGWLLSGELLGLVLITLLAVPLTLGWRLAGRRVEFRQITLIGAYVYGGMWLGLCGGALIVGYGLQVVDATVFDRVVALLAGAAPGAPAASTERWTQAEATLQGVLHGPAAAMLVVALLTWLVTAVWAVVAWGAFRNAFGAGRLQTAGATLLWLAMLGALVWLCVRLA
jgi:hypothetical protein